MTNLYDAECLMCDGELYWNDLYNNWSHSENRSIYCPRKTASIATPKDEEKIDDEL